MAARPEKLAPEELYCELDEDASVLAEFPLLAAFFDWWLSLRGGAEMPSVRAVDALDIPRDVLGFVFLFDVETAPDGAPRFRVRLMGTKAVEQAGKDTTGRYVDEVPGASEVQERFAALVETRRPYFADTPLNWTERKYKRYRTVVCPLADPSGSDPKGARVVRLVAIAVFT